MPLTVVMYHYVRPLVGSAFPDIKGLELSRFKAQLDHIERNHHVVSAKQAIEASCGGAALPHDAMLLTFDDGYVDHYEYVYPELKRRGMSGVFFPSAEAVTERVLLDVNKVHFLLASVRNLDPVFAYIESEVTSATNEFEVLSLLEYREKYFKANRNWYLLSL